MRLFVTQKLLIKKTKGAFAKQQQTNNAHTKRKKNNVRIEAFELSFLIVFICLWLCVIAQFEFF